MSVEKLMREAVLDGDMWLVRLLVEKRGYEKHVLALVWAKEARNAKLVEYFQRMQIDPCEAMEQIIESKSPLDSVQRMLMQVQRKIELAMLGSVDDRLRYVQLTQYYLVVSMHHRNVAAFKTLLFNCKTVLHELHWEGDGWEPFRAVYREYRTILAEMGLG